MDKVAKVIRILTIPPVLALLLSTVFFVHDSSLVGGVAQYCMLIATLSILPVLAYPLQPFIPGFKDRGREGQRSLAFAASIAGYICGIILAFATKAPITIHIVYWTYFVSVTALTLFNKLSPWRASGHACGVAGPAVVMICFIGTRCLPMILVFILSCWASIKTKRHTLTELIIGGVDSVAAFLLVLLVSRLFV